MPDLDPLSAPEITLRGKTYKLPQLELSQIIPLTVRLLRMRNANIGSVEEMTEEKLLTLYDVAYLALTLVDPTVSREKFDARPPSYPELLAAIPVIMRQSRFVDSVPAGEKPRRGKRDRRSTGKK